MRKPTAMDDSQKLGNSEAKASATRRPEPRSQGASSSPELVECSSFTQPIDSQEKIRKSHWDSLKGTAAIDWFQLAARIKWDAAKSEKQFERLRNAKEVAQENRRLAQVTIGSDLVSVASSGTGGGRDSHKEIQLIWKDVRIGLSERESPTRQLSNGSLQVSGGPCLITGAGVAWDFFTRLIRCLGGTIIDEWIRRLDICIDIPDLSFSQSVYPLLLNGQINTSCRDKHFHESGGKATGFSTGNSGRLRVLIYDKLHDCLGKHDSVYIAAMQQRRWGGLPLAATRVEWQMGRAWLQQFDLDTAVETMRRMPDVFSKLTNEIGGSFRITDRVPDRANGHQSRVASHPIWTRVVEIGRAKIGAPETTLKRVDRSSLDERKAIMQIVGFATSIADRRHTICETVDDLLRVIKETMGHHQIGDAMILERFMKKAKASGAWQDIFSFPGKEAA